MDSDLEAVIRGTTTPTLNSFISDVSETIVPRAVDWWLRPNKGLSPGPVGRFQFSTSGLFPTCQKEKKKKKKKRITEK